MLYVSRMLGQNRFGVVDTDDGSESVCTYGDLMDYVLRLGLDIKGVVVDTQYRKGKPKPYVRSIQVAQDLSQVTRQQTKAKVLMGVDIKTYGDQITSISADKGLANKTTVRLSDYGTSCGEYIFRNMPWLTGGVLVLVLDDKIKLNAKSFKDFVSKGVVVDMREVTDKKTVSYIASELAHAESWLQIIAFSIVLDTDARIDYYKAETVLQRQSNTRPEIRCIDDCVANPTSINNIISKKHKAEFLAVARAEYHPAAMLRWVSFSKNYARWIYEGGYELLARGRYDDLINSRFKEIFSVLREISTCNRNVMLRFENYCKYFHPTDELKAAFVSMCRRSTDFIMEVGHKENWFAQVKR